MNIDTALQSTLRLYLDTAPLIYYFEEYSSYISKMDRIFDLIAKTPVVTFSAVHILTEVMVKPLQTGNHDLAQEYRDILVHSDAHTLVPITLPIAESAADLRARYNLRAPDALHVATAISAGCDGVERKTQMSINMKVIAVTRLETRRGDPMWTLQTACGGPRR